MKKLTYFPGCSAHGTSEEFDHTLKLVMKKLDVELEEIPDWNCCGATSAHVMTEALAMALPLRNLVLAEKLDSKTMGIACASCYSRMKTTKVQVDENPELARKINSTIIQEAIIRMAIFMMVAGIVSFESHRHRRTEEALIRIQKAVESSSEAIGSHKE